MVHAELEHLLAFKNVSGADVGAAFDADGGVFADWVGNHRQPLDNCLGVFLLSDVEESKRNCEVPGNGHIELVLGSWG